VRQLAGKITTLERSLATCELARLAGRLTSTSALDRLAHHGSGDLRILLEEDLKLLVDDVLREALDLGVPELGLGLTLELGLGDPHRQHAGEALADVLARQVHALVALEQ